MESLSKSLSHFGSFTRHQLSLIQDATVLRTVEKEEFILKPGQVCRALYFVVSGAFTRFWINKMDKRQYLDLYTTGDWMIDRASFLSQTPSEVAIQSYRYAVIGELSLHDIHRLIGISQSFLQLGKILYDSPGNKIRLDAKLPDDRYLYMLEHRPEVLLEFPQKMVASLLKMTPETLSRVRKRIAHRQNVS